MTQGDGKTVMDVFSVCNILYKVSRKPLLPFSPKQRHIGPRTEGTFGYRYVDLDCLS